MQTFKTGLSAETSESMSVGDYERLVKDIEGLADAVKQVSEDANPAVQASAIEFVLEGLHLNKRLNKDTVSGQARYRA